MGCCGRGILLAEFFENGYGRFFILLFFLLIITYVISFTIVTCVQKTYLPNQSIELKQNRDFALSKNNAGYGGYIRFETRTLVYAGSQPEQIPTAKIALKLQKDSQPRHAVKIELFNKTHRFITELVLKKESFEPVKSGYSYNKLTLQLPGDYTLNDAAYFRYSLIED